MADLRLLLGHFAYNACEVGDVAREHEQGDIQRHGWRFAYFPVPKVIHDLFETSGNLRQVNRLAFCGHRFLHNCNSAKPKTPGLSSLFFTFKTNGRMNFVPMETSVGNGSPFVLGAQAAPRSIAGRGFVMVGRRRRSSGLPVPRAGLPTCYRPAALLEGGAPGSTRTLETRNG